MKLSDWATKQGISYLTAWRWYKAKDPRLAGAYQSASGTIIVPDSPVKENNMETENHTNDNFLFIKKAIDFCKNNSSIEEFVAFTLSNFTLKSLGTIPSKNIKKKASSEEIQNEYKNIILSVKNEKEKPEPNMFCPSPDQLEDLDKVEAILDTHDTDEIKLQKIVDLKNQFKGNPNEDIINNYIGQVMGDAVDSYIDSVLDQNTSESINKKGFLDINTYNSNCAIPTQTYFISNLVGSTPNVNSNINLNSTLSSAAINSTDTVFTSLINKAETSSTKELEHVEESPKPKRKRGRPSFTSK